MERLLFNGENFVALHYDQNVFSKIEFDGVNTLYFNNNEEELHYDDFISEGIMAHYSNYKGNYYDVAFYMR